MRAPATRAARASASASSRSLAASRFASRRGEIVALLGPVGQRQDDGAAAGRRVRDARRRARRRRGRGRHAPAARAPALRHGLPALRAVSAPDVGENVAFGLEAGASRARRRAARVAEALGAGRPRRLRARAGSRSSPAASSSGSRSRARSRPSRACCCSTSRCRTSTRRCASGRGASCERAIRRIGITTLFVTHEQEEAFDLGDRVAVLYAGRLEQVGTPEELYERPATRFVGGVHRAIERRCRVRWESGRRAHSRRTGLAGARGRAARRRRRTATSSSGPEALAFARGVVRDALPATSRAPLRGALRLLRGRAGGGRRARGARARRTPPRVGDRVLVAPVAGRTGTARLPARAPRPRDPPRARASWSRRGGEPRGLRRPAAPVSSGSSAIPSC